MKSWQLVAFGVLCGLAASGLVFLVASQPTGYPVRLIPRPTNRPLSVDVVGEVRQPGVYELPPGSRVQDAIQAAGGPTGNARPDAINQAELLSDGMRVWVPAADQVSLAVTPVTTALNPSGITPTPQFPININIASSADLDALPGIGPTRAQAIVSYRQEHGVFTSIDELQDVPGIGPVTFENLKALVTVGETE